jgi:hypothetical protein
MKNEFKMLEAINKTEAIKSIIDILYENPLWTNKCTSDLFAVIKCLTVTDAEKLLNRIKFEQVRSLFIELKTEYYNFKENTQWN